MILVAGDAGATAANIFTHELLMRAGVVSNLFCQVSFVFLVLALNRLFHGINDKLAKLMLALVISAVPIAVVNELCQVAALEFSSRAPYLAVLSPEQRSALMLTLLNVHQSGISVAGIFWGLWLFPFGLLVIQSGFIPKVLGVLLIVGCFSYLIDSSVALLAPQHGSAVSDILMLPLALGEISMVLWFLIKGVRANGPVASA